MELWRNVLSRGQDAMCFKCRQHSGEEVNTNQIVCDQCARIKAKANFDEAMQEKWKTLSKEAIICKTCSVVQHHYTSSDFIRCDGAFCQGQQVPEYHFIEELLTEWQAKKAYKKLHDT